jgi:hypothetical protein
MFENNWAFDQDIGAWQLTSAKDLSNMLQNTKLFDNAGSDSINNWDTSKVTSFNHMFYNAGAFNRDISGWTITGAPIMTRMFKLAKAFNKDISGWTVGSVTSCNEFRIDSILTCANVPTQLATGCTLGTSSDLNSVCP